MRARRALERIDSRLGELVEELRKQHELDREVNRREHEQTRASFAQVNRETLLELRDHRTILERIDHGVEASTKRLMHVLDEPRNWRRGPGTAPAA
jgi:hypothetical protein